jgi:Lamin Tail Domain/PLD-like domain
MKTIARLLFTLLILATSFTRATGASSHRSALATNAESTFSVLITAIYFDPYLTGEGSEAIQVQNIGSDTVPLAGWTLSDDKGTFTFPGNASLLTHQKVWASKNATAFRQEFGFAPAYEYGGALSLSNPGDAVILKSAQGQVVDAVPYKSGSVPPPDWSGPTVAPYQLGCTSCEGQILYRKLRENDGLPVPDTNMADDWAQDTGDSFLGKRVQYPGWDVDKFFQTARATERATVKYCVAPDHLFNCYRDEILRATRSISVETYSLESAGIVDAITHQLQRGVRFTALLDAGALTDQGKWACQQIEARGGECWLMDSKPWENIYARYANQHSKWTLVDGKWLLVGSENIGDDAMPNDDKSDGTVGARGGYLITDSPTLVARAQAVLDRDFDPLNHADIRRWGTSANDFPPPGYVPPATNGNIYPVKFPTPYETTGTFSFELVQCPENCLRAGDALLGLVSQAGVGDALLVEQLYEYKYWGASSSNPVADPNPRLEAYIDAAKRGARVRILLDSFYDTFSDARSNYATCRYINALSTYYPIECRLGNPTGRGIHNKMVLLKHGGAGWVHLGSINGSETSSKSNRELAAQVESLDAFNYWAQVFDYDWSVSTLSPRELFLPIILR